MISDAPPSVKTGLVEALTVAGFSLAIGFQHGLSYGIGNHNTYLLSGLRLFEPGLFANDWLVMQTTAYHPFFSWLTLALYAISPAGWGFAFANVITIALTSFLLYKIVAELMEREYVLPTYLLLMALISATETYSVSGSYIFCRTFQPSSIGSLGLVAGFLYFLKGRYIVSGIWLALGGIFHVNFLILSFPLFFFAHVGLGKVGILSRLVRQLGFPVLALLPLLPLMFEASMSPEAAVARRVFQEIHAPQHYVPLSYFHEFYVFAGWHILGIIAGGILIPFTTRAGRSFNSIFISQLSLIVLATVLTTVVFIPVISQLYFWRLAPFSIVLVQLMGCSGVVKRLSEPSKKGNLTRQALLTAICAVSILSIWYYHYGWYRQLNVRILIAIAIVVLLAGRFEYIRGLLRERRIKLVATFAVVICLVSVLVPYVDFMKKSSLLTGLPRSEEALYKWAVDETPLNAVFLIPPKLQNFRLHAKRAVIVDSKSPPVLPDELMEWYHRLETISGIEGFTNRHQPEIGYNQLNGQSLELIHKVYTFDYAVVRKQNKEQPFSSYETVYENRGFLVLRYPEKVKEASLRAN